MKKKFLATLLAAAMVCALLPTAALAADVTVTEVVPPKYTEANDFSEGLAAVRDENNKLGFIDAAGKEVVPCKYWEVKDFSEGLAAVLDESWKYGFIDKTGKEVVPCKYDYVRDFSEGLAMVNIGYDAHKGGGKSGFIDKTGKVVVPCKYDNARDFHEGLAAVAVESDGKDRWGNALLKWGFIDATGKEVVPCKYDELTYYGGFSDGLAAVKLGDKWGFIDKTGTEVVPCKYDYVRDFSEGLAVVNTGFIWGGVDDKLGGKWGFVDTTGTEVVPLKYDHAWDFSEGLAAVQIGSGLSSTGFIDKTGKEVIPRYFGGVQEFSEGLAAVYLGGIFVDEWGYIDKTYVRGRGWVIDAKYDRARGFSEGLAAVGIGEFPDTKWGFIDKTGKEIIPCKYDSARDFDQGLAAVELDGKWGYISVNGSTPSSTAYASTQTVTVDGKPVTFYAYALKEGNGMTNYIKLRDVAQILNGSAAQFQVGWDGSITITTKTAYTPNGSEMVQNFTGNQSYTISTNPVTVNGQPTNLEAITLTDGKGGGYNYFKLRDLGAALGFNVTWSADTGISIDPNTPYDTNN